MMQKHAGAAARTRKRGRNMEQVMRNIPAILLTGLMAVAAAFAIGAFTAQEAHAAELDEGVLYVGGQDIARVGSDIIRGDDDQGYASLAYDGDGNPVLELNDFKCENYSDKEKAVIQCGNIARLTIYLTGDNAVKVSKSGTTPFGIWSQAPLVIKGTGSLNVTGGGDYSVSAIGINCNGGLQIESGNITATAESGDGAPKSNYAIASAEIITINGGTVKASGGNAKDFSYGIYSRKGVEINGGDVTASTDATSASYKVGIFGDWVTIGGDVAKVEAAGDTAAIEGTTKNYVPGKGWNNTAGTGDAAAILINKDGAKLYYQKMVFEPKLDISITGNSSTVTYNAKEQSVSGYTVKYNVGDGNWIDEAPAGVSVKLKENYTAVAKGTDVKTYKMGLTAASFDINRGHAKEGELTVTDGALTIEKVPLTIKANDQTLTYNGQTQGEGDTAYADPAEIAEKVTASGLQGSDKLTSIVIDGQGTEIGEYPITPSGAAVGNATGNYDITYVNGTLTITKAKPKPTPPQPKPDPKPQPKVNKAAAKTSLDAGVIAKSSGSKVTASWGAVKGASSYVIYANYCDQKKLKKIKTVSGKTTSFDITKLNGKKFDPKKNLKFYVVAYKTVKGKKVKLAKSILAHAPGSKNSKRTNVIGVKVKKASFRLKKGKTAKIKAKLVLEKKHRKPLKHCAKFRYATSNAKVAKVSKKGKITAVGKGKCTVYVYAVSGVSKKIKVTVK